MPAETGEGNLTAGVGFRESRRYHCGHPSNLPP
jgi:hypothetical protein